MRQPLWALMLRLARSFGNYVLSHPCKLSNTVFCGRTFEKLFQRWKPDTNHDGQNTEKPLLMDKLLDRITQVSAGREAVFSGAWSCSRRIAHLI